MLSYTYDNSTPEGLEAHAKNLIGHSFKDIVGSSPYKLESSRAEYQSASRKGGLGNLIEELYFGYKANSDSAADFKEAGVELKVTPYEIKKDGSIKAGERLVLTMISYTEPVEPNLFKSHLWKKCALILVIVYLRDREKQDRYEYEIRFAKLFTPPKEDLVIIEEDYKYITTKIENGVAEQLSEGDTMYLGACTKGATAETSIVPQYYPPHTQAKKRAFCYKTSYMTFVLQKYIAGDVTTYEPIVKKLSDYEGKSFKDIIYAKIQSYIGASDTELCDILNVNADAKSKWSDLAFAMLGVKSNKAEEFAKANIKVKAIRLEENNRLIESMSFPAMDPKILIKENWDDSWLYNYFNETKFLFVVFKKNGNNYILKGCQLWNMPYNDLNDTARSGWLEIQKIFKAGIKLWVDSTGRMRNNLPPMKSNRVIHMRPHASQKYYVLEDGIPIGPGSETDAYELPDGRWMAKHCFWLNNSYILSQLDNRFFYSE